MAPEPWLTVCGHANIDVQITVDRLPKAGQSAPVRSRRRVYGGTACNIAVHAASLGVATRLWARVGVDFPSDWRAALEGAGVLLDGLVADEATSTPTCFVVTDASGAQSFLMDQGAMGAMTQNPPAADALPQPGGWLHLATGDPRAYLDIAASAKATGVHVAVDPGQELRFMYDDRVLERLLRHADVLFLNEVELAEALSMFRYGEADQLLDHVETLVVTRGANGASLYRLRKPRLDLPAAPVEAVDPTGAGDALRAGWYAALADGRPMEDALAWGQAAAAVCVGHEGPQSHLVRRDEVAPLVAEMRA